jgi:iron-sulfur cluster repair protein YtfE (RIC family)
VAEKWVDPLEQLIRQHRNISEYVMDFEKVSDFVHNPETWKSPEFDDFLKKYFYDHFMFEERKVFPVLVKKAGNPKLNEIIQELYKEHEEMLAKVSRIRGAVKKGEVDREIFMLVKEVFNQLLEHAGKEDDELIPLIQKNRKIFEGL